MKTKAVIWCEICGDWIKRSELRAWSGDGSRHYLCPGCGSDLLPSVNIDLEYDKWIQAKEDSRHGRI